MSLTAVLDRLMHRTPPTPRPPITNSSDIPPLVTADLANPRLAWTLGFDPKMLPADEWCILRYMLRQQMPIYPYAAVSAYMARVATKRGKLFVWRPLSFQDIDVAMFGKVDEHDHYRPGYTRQCAPWMKALPAHIDGDVQNLRRRFPKARFMVAYAADPDPFICVTTRAMPHIRIVFGAWDEPAFGTID